MEYSMMTRTFELLCARCHADDARHPSRRCACFLPVDPRSAITRERTSTAAAIPTNITARARLRRQVRLQRRHNGQGHRPRAPGKIPSEHQGCPNSDTARARQRTMPLVIPGHASGRVTYQKLAQAEAPVDCRGFLYLLGYGRNPSLAPECRMSPRRKTAPGPRLSW